MNLVAKEYVAAQNPLQPGVLILSEFAGAAAQLDGALMVNPFDVDAIARAMTTALAMPAQERGERWRAMMATLEDADIGAWYTAFMNALEVTSPSLVGPAEPVPAAIRTRASGHSEDATVAFR